MAKNLSLFDLVPGKLLFDRWELLSPHRQCGMSAAFEVNDVTVGESLEMQVFHSGLFEGRDQGREFAERLAGWVDVDCPAVSDVRSVEALDDGTVLLFTEFPEGRVLREVMAENGPAKTAEVLALGDRMLEGLEACHGAGLVHGDVKPEGLFVGPGLADCVVYDGGVTPALWSAKHLGTRTTLIGTPYYAPLEQFTGDSPDDLSDLYNVATLLYEVATGVLPWRGKGYVEVFQSKMQKSPPRMRELAPDVEVPADLEAAIAHGLAGSRTERYATAEEFRAALAALTA